MICRAEWISMLVFLISAVGVSAQTLPDQISSESLARIESPGKILELVGVARSPKDARLRIAIAESDPKQGLLAYQVHQFDPDTAKTTLLFRTELSQGGGTHGFLPNQLCDSSVLIAQDHLILSGRFQFGYSTLRKLRDTGKLLREVPHPSENVARSSSPPTTGILVTERDEILVLGHYVCLYDSDLDQKWQLLPEQSDATDGLYNANTQQFILARQSGKLNKFGMPNDSRPQIIVVVVDLAGKPGPQTVLDGITPHLARTPDGFLLLRDTLQKQDRFILTRFDFQLRQLKASVLSGVPEPGLPSVFPLRLILLPNGHVITIGNPMANLFAREWDEQGHLLSANDSLWPTPVGGELWLQQYGDDILMVTGEYDPQQPLSSGIVRVDRLKLHR